MTNETTGHWALLSNHGQVLLYIAEHPDATISRVADVVGLTERATASILRDLREARFIAATRVGRRNTYHVDPTRTLRPQITDRALNVGDLLSGLLSGPLPAVESDLERWDDEGGQGVENGADNMNER